MVSLMRRGFKTFLLALIVGILFVSVGGSSASATEQVVHSTVAVSATDDEIEDYVRDTLTISRWGDSVGQLHFKRDWSDLASYTADATNRTVLQPALMGLGTSGWSMTSIVVEQAVTLDVVRSLTSAIDGIMGVVLRSLFTTQASGFGSVSIIGWVMIFAIIGVMIAVIQRLRGRALLVRVVSVLVLAAYLVFSASALMNHERGEGQYEPPVGTPSWVALTISDSIGTVADIPAAAIMQASDTVNEITVTGAENDASCDSYLGALHDRRALWLGQVSSDEVREKISRGSQVAEVVDRLWQQSGLLAYETVAAGQNQYASDVWCRVLDLKANNVSSGMAATATALSLAPPGTAADADSLADFYQQGSRDADKKLLMFAAEGSDQQNQALLGWAACTYDFESDTWSLKPGWEGFNGRANNQSCVDWSEAKVNAEGDVEAGEGVDAFDISGKDSKITSASNDAAKSDEVLNLVGTLQGMNASSSTLYALVYLITAPFAQLPLLLLSLMALVTRLMVIGFLFAAWFVLLAALFSPTPFSEKVLPLVKRLLSSTILAYGTTFLLAMLAVISFALVDVVLTGGVVPPIVGISWASLAPLVALVMLHFVFTKVFKLASPVTFKGMTSWNAAAPMVGGAVGGAAGSAIANRFDRGASEAAKRAGSAALGKVTGGKLGSAPSSGSGGGGLRRSMTPTTDSGGAVAGGALAGGALAGGGALTPKETKQLRGELFNEYRAVNGAAHELDGKGRRMDYRDAVAGFKVKQQHALNHTATNLGQLSKTVEGRTMLSQQRSQQRVELLDFKKQQREQHGVGVRRAIEHFGEREATALGFSKDQFRQATLGSKARIVGGAVTDRVITKDVAKRAAMMAAGTFVAGGTGLVVSGAAAVKHAQNKKAQHRAESNQQLAEEIQQLRQRDSTKEIEQ